ncbi:MAG: DUF3999 family protein [Chloroflexi bacterium]|nr:DUF3999 family protein [Chloroflexota bacterium]
MGSRRLRTASRLAAAALIFLLAASSAAADFTLGDWRYVKAISLPSNLEREGLVELVPDREVFSGSAAGQADLRVIAGEDTEVPYKLEIAAGEHQRASLTVTLRDKGYVAGRYSTFIADLGREGLLHNELEIQVPPTSINFRRTATVETSKDGDSWAQVGGGQVYDFTVFDFTGRERRFTARDTRVRYPESTARYLRVRVADEGEGPLEIAGADVFFVKETPAVEASWPIASLSTSRDADRRATLVDMDLGAAGLPTSRLALAIDDVNVYREVSLEGSADRKRWTVVQPTGAIYSYDTPKFVGKSLDITYPEATSRYLRLVLHDQDNPPLTVQGVEVWGLRRRLIFTAAPGRSYKLYYGNPEARRPSYDIEKVFPYLVTSDLPRVQVGPQSTNPRFVEKRPPVSERFPWLLPSAVAVAGVLVALLLLGAVRRIRKALPPPGQ